IGQQRSRNAAVIEILFGKRIVGSKDSMLHRHVETSRRFAAPRYAYQDDLGLTVAIDARAIVILQRIVHRADALLVLQFAGAAVAATDSKARLGAKRPLEW